MVMVEAAAAPFRPKVLPAPRWSHWTTVGEKLQPVAKTCVPPGIGRIAGPSMQEQQRRVLAVFAANRDPLLEAADLNIVRFVDSVWCGDRIVPRVASA